MRRRIALVLVLVLALAAAATACHRPRPDSDVAGVAEEEKGKPQNPTTALPPPPLNSSARGSGGIGAPAPPPNVAFYQSAPPASSVVGGVEGGVLGGVLGGPAAPNEPKLLLAREIASADELVVVSRDQAVPEPARIAGGESASPTQGTLKAQDAEGKLLGEFPLKHTQVSVQIGGYLARTVVRQEYANPFTQAIEAVYVFPLGSMAAVNDFVMETGGRRIVGVVRPREEAERIYQEARARGQTASLLTQERPNIFTQNVANIEPGGTVCITLTTFERLAYEKGTYEYAFPMVVGPRYIPGTPQTAVQAGRQTEPAPGAVGWAPPTDVVPDAPRITPPVLKPGERSGHDIGLTVDLEAGFPIRDLTCPSHQVSMEEGSVSRRHVELLPADTIPNKDFVLRWRVDGDRLQTSLLAHRGPEGGYFTLMVQPPLDPRDADVSPREVTFILDISGSMSGVPLEASKALVRRVLDRLRPQDLFNLFVFAGGNGQLWESPRANTEQNVAEAKRYLDSLQGSGGTEMLAGLSRALKGHHDPRYVQLFVFCTDGFVGDEERILQFIRDERGEARFFGFGIGSSVNRFLIDGIGEAGAGRSMVVLPRSEKEAQRASDAFFGFIDSPVLLDVAVDWNGLPVEETYPRKPGDLFAGGTLNLVGRYTGPAKGKAYVTGTVAGKRVRLPVEVVLPQSSPDHEELGPVWARWKIHEMTTEMAGAGPGRQEELKQAITELAVAHRLVSPFTAFVAVDESRIVGDGRPLTILQPVEIPDGVSYAGIFGEPGTGEVREVTGWGLRLQQTRSGKVRVGEVEDASPAKAAGVSRGAALVSVGGVQVHDLAHLEGLLLQTNGKKVRVAFEPGREVELPSP